MKPVLTDADCDLVVLAPNPWQGQWVNRQQLFSRLGIHHRVVYSTGGFYLWERNSADWRQGSMLGSFEAHDNVQVDMPAKLLARLPRMPSLDRLSLRLQATRWRRQFGRPNGRPLVAYIFHPLFLPYVEFIGADHVVYHVYDKYDQTPNWTAELEAAECQLARTADLVVASSDAMADGLRAKGALTVQVLPNGADVPAFQRAVSPQVPEPDDLKAIPRPRIGWAGSLHPYVDCLMIAELAQRHPDWQFVMVGAPSPQADATAEAARAVCRSLHKIHFFGGKPANIVPLYSAKMDVNILCYLLQPNTWIGSISPLKLHEYLACGHPVISADLPAVYPFLDVVRVASGTDDWELAIAQALAGTAPGTPGQRQEVAAANSWDCRVETLTVWLELLCRPGGRTTRAKHAS